MKKVFLYRKNKSLSVKQYRNNRKEFVTFMNEIESFSEVKLRKHS